MRTLVIALALTSAAFAGTTVYFAHQLSVERERNAALSLSSPRGTTPANGIEPAGEPLKADTRTSVAQGETVKAEFLSEPGEQVGEADIRKYQKEYGRNFLAELADPVRRKDLMDERKLMVRSRYPRLDRAIGLTADEYSRFIEQLAKQQLDVQEASARCMVDDNCPMKVPAYEPLNLADDTSREINEILGPARVQKFEQYKNTMGERESVSQLRNRLADDQRLSEDGAEGLIAALADERQSIYREASQQGSDLNGYGFGAGMVFSSTGSVDPEASYESAQRNSQRLRDRAAQFLNTEQMRAFNEIQDESLMGLRRVLRNKDTMPFVTAGADEAN